MPDQHSDAVFTGDDARELAVAHARFEDCQFERCAWAGRALTKASFIDCVFRGCDFTVAKLTDSVFVRTRFVDCRLAGINWSLAGRLEAVSFERCQLNDGTLVSVNLEGCSFVDCASRGVTFRDVNLRKASFPGTDLEGAEFLNCDLGGADFRGAVGYLFSPVDNRVAKARFSLPEAMGLLKGLGVVIE